MPRENIEVDLRQLMISNVYVMFAESIQVDSDMATTLRDAHCRHFLIASELYDARYTTSSKYRFARIIYVQQHYPIFYAVSK